MAIQKALPTKPDSETAQKIIGQAPSPAACWETAAPGGAGTCGFETAQDPGGLESMDGVPVSTIQAKT